MLHNNDIKPVRKNRANDKKKLRKTEKAVGHSAMSHDVVVTDRFMVIINHHRTSYVGLETGSPLTMIYHVSLLRLCPR